MSKSRMETLQEEYDWRELRGIVEILRATKDKEIAETFADDSDTSWIYRKTYEAVLFTDGTGLVVRTDHGWVGTEVTGGSEMEVDYFLLTPKGLP